MTSEVVLMNRQTVAMAADSAVTISGAGYLKTYNSADKLFQLVEGQPVAVMIYNNAEIMNVPWETVISLYRDHSNGRPLDTIDAYAKDFMNFLSGNPDLFPAEHQDTEYFKMVAVIFSYIAHEFDRQLRQFRESGQGNARQHANSILDFVVDQLHTDYQLNIDDTQRADLECFPQAMEEQVRRRYGRDIDDLIASLADALQGDVSGLRVSDDTREKLRDIAAWVATKDAFFEHYTGVVFAGFGRQERFPSMRSYLTSNVVLGILKHRQDRAADISADGAPVIQPFAQDRMIRAFITGMDQNLRMFMFGETLKLTYNLLADVINRAPGVTDTDKQKMFEDYSENNLNHALMSFFRTVDAYQYQVHTLPIFRAIQNLPKKELGEMAASLVKLNSLQQKMTASVETVGGPVDVAVITRNGGLEWHKESAAL
ncbi:MAG: hypothetical protein AAGC95_16165 [Pseudomonadota bacterium]